MPAYNKLLWGRYNDGGDDDDTPPWSLVQNTRPGGTGDGIETNCRVGRKIPLIQQAIGDAAVSAMSKECRQPIDSTQKCHETEQRQGKKNAKKPVNIGPQHMRFYNLGQKSGRTLTDDEIAAMLAEAYGSGLWP